MCIPPISVLPPFSPGNPYDKAVTIRRTPEGVKLFCQLCDKMFQEYLWKARCSLLEHYVRAHGVDRPKLRSFFEEEFVITEGGFVNHADRSAELFVKWFWRKETEREVLQGSSNRLAEPTFPASTETENKPV